MGKVKPITVGIAGLGRAGWNIHVDGMRNRKDFKITACCDPESDRRTQAEQELGCETFTNYKEMLKKADAELIVVATQSRDHGPHTIAALKTGRHVLVEKPMAMSLREADRMIAAAKKARKKLFVNQNYRFNQEFKHLREMIGSGILGRVFHIRGHWPGFARRNDWQTLRKYGGGVLNNTCPHIIDMTLQFIGWPVRSVWGDLQLVNDAGDVEDHVKIVLRGKSGCTADLEVSTACAYPTNKWMLMGDCGTLICDGKESKIKYYDPKRVKALKVIESPPANRRYGNDDKLPWREKTVPVKSRDKTSYFDTVVATLRHGKPMAVTPESVREVIRVIAETRKGTAFPG
ncbi:MAG: Gfo/Idh/MocA family oxidoreductase [Phycisphaerae bacterium]|nr:Gfo/Idh/MocA family oxidoreductase [Phycisphaerae bacterium]